MITAHDVTQKHRLENKVCLIVGNKNELSLSIGKRLVQAGARVVLALEGEAVNDEKETIVTRSHDIGSEDAWLSLSAYIMEHYGRLDLLINASFSANPESLDETTFDLICQSSGVMIESIAMACKYLMPTIKMAESGAIINLAPATGLIGLPEGILHAVATGAIGALTRSLAIHGFESGKGVRCNAIFIPVKNNGDILIKSDDIANAVIYLGSAEAGYVNGHSITLNKGLSEIALSVHT